MKKKFYRDSICPECGEPCRVIALDLSFSVPGRINGSETVYPSGHGTPVSDCCEVQIHNAEEEIPSWW